MKRHDTKTKQKPRSKGVDAPSSIALQPPQSPVAPAATGGEGASAAGDRVSPRRNRILRPTRSTDEGGVRDTLQGDGVQDAPKPANVKPMVSLSSFVENPRNPSTATEADIERLAGKLRRVPLGLTAMRLAYCRDIVPGKLTVISGNKRLRVLKRAYGEDGQIPADWVQDVTAMSEAERHEFIITANTSDGSWDIDALMADYDKAELDALMKPGELDELLATVGTAAPAETDMEAFDDLDSGDPAADEVKCMVGRTRIPITKEEADLLLARYQAYVERQSVGYGFFYELLGVNRDGDEHSA